MGPLPEFLGTRSFCLEFLQGSALSPSATVSFTRPSQSPVWCWSWLVRGYSHDDSKPVLAGGGHALAGHLNLTDSAMEISQVTSQGSLVHCVSGKESSLVGGCIPSSGKHASVSLTHEPNLPLAARGTVGRSWTKPRSSGKCWLSDLARMCRKVDFPSTVLVEFSCKGRPPQMLLKVPPTRLLAT